MIDGIILAIGIILILLSRYMYCKYNSETDINEDDNRSIFHWALYMDIGGTIMIVLSLLDYYLLNNL